MHASQRFSDTFPNGFASLIASTDSRRRNAGGYELRPERLPLLNDALHRVSPDSPSVDLDQMATAARRVLERYPMGARPAFVDSRMKAMQRTMAGAPMPTCASVSPPCAPISTTPTTCCRTTCPASA